VALTDGLGLEEAVSADKTKLQQRQNLR
jgi:hypothetical protein